MYPDLMSRALLFGQGFKLEMDIEALRKDKEITMKILNDVKARLGEHFDLSETQKVLFICWYIQSLC